MPNRSTDNSNPDGTKAFYLLLKRLKVNVEQWTKPISELSKEEGLFIIIDPIRNITPEESEQIINWVEQGNSLLFLEDTKVVRHKIEMTEELKSDIELWQKVGIPIRYEDREIVIEDTKNAVLEKLGLKLKSSPPKVKSLSPIQPGGYTKKVNKIQVKIGSRLTTERLDAVPYFRDEDGVLLSTLKYGKGKIIILSEPELASNKSIRYEDNITLLTNITIGEAKGRKVLIDEIHHFIPVSEVGLGEKKTIFEYFWEPPKRWVVLQLTLVMILFFYSKGVRFGQAIPRQEQRRSISEHIEAISNIYRKAKAHDLALQAIYRDFKFSLGNELALRGEVDKDHILDLLPAKLSNRVVKIMKECEEYISKRTFSETALIRLTRRLEAIKKEVKSHARIRM